MNQSDSKEKIRAAIRRSKEVWWTATDLAKETGIPLETTLSLLETSGTFLRAYHTNPLGQSVFTTREKYLADLPWPRRLLDLLANKVGV
ncbi:MULTISPECIES: hypothetical protein [unclassified Duganella]|jgi:hypothetical protein|uniref:hypothetical protein n=1 Tax=unclassified Duganella TaxID=2636909 RepID=UPI0008887FDE|nr:MULTISPECIES: hypothetical protein [unclassified Duganella]SDG68751.1 hypothetical protein SAMN05216320_106172 [Duganella sp. OV458]SDJ94084.1 hypothetical protein SAMN05428973_107172 [Duganella sp. OV510]